MFPNEAMPTVLVLGRKSTTTFFWFIKNSIFHFKWSKMERTLCCI